MKSNNENSDKNSDKKISKVKEVISAFKEAWAIPSKRAGIKLLGYLVFFIIFFIIAGIGSMSSGSNIREGYYTDSTTTVIDKEAYSYKQKLLLENKHIVYYEIKLGEVVYKINGTLNNGILEGYLESNDGIKKIKLENGILYNIVGEEFIQINDVNVNFTDIKIILNEIKDKRAYIENNDDLKIYNYDNIYNIADVSGIDIKVYVNSETISKIEVFEGSSSYVLNFDI